MTPEAVSPDAVSPDAAPIRVHTLSARSQVEEGRFVGWLTYSTAAYAAEGCETLRTTLARHGLVVEKQVREMAIPRSWR